MTAEKIKVVNFLFKERNLKNENNRKIGHLHYQFIFFIGTTIFNKNIRL